MGQRHAGYYASGDTLETLATSYRLPLWSLTQVITYPMNASSRLGTQVVVPRDLVPPPRRAIAPSRQARWKRRPAQSAER